MPDDKRECPMCGELMRLKEITRVDPIPGMPEVHSKAVLEWVCPECDYFEDVDPADVDH